MIIVTEATASAGAGQRPPGEAVRTTTTSGVRAADGVPRPPHEVTGGRDGRVLPQAGPRLARATAAPSPADGGTGERLNPAYEETRSVTEPAVPGAVATVPEAAPYATAARGTLRSAAVTGGDVRSRTAPAAVRRLGPPYDEAVRPQADEGAARSGDARRDPLGAVTKSLDDMGVDAE
ncbi:hypothetical protein [Streptomyces sp. Tu 3180]|uniref:hypothetical protein n=1 Tax=Streptomyces sp. Tu 3180 TaxID=2682611 RepID=UPI00135A85CD|nr:hypothetical protein [Streptomyces sp. Tu 3180]KAF3468564.1 hypothetical protein GL259_32655 [Streptomyces sp. Tu 3180]